MVVAFVGPGYVGGEYRTDIVTVRLQRNDNFTLNFPREALVNMQKIFTRM